MKKIICVILTVCMIFASVGTVYANGDDEYDNNKCGDNLTWTLDKDGTLTISGTGDMENWDFYTNSYPTPWLNYCNDIKKVVISDGVTSIGNYAFCELYYVTDITIPGSVKSIGDRAFYECSSLKNAELLDGVESIGEEAFAYCDLETIRMTDSVKYVGDRTFCWCVYLVNINLSDNISKISKEMFWGCRNLENVNLPKNLTYISDNASLKCPYAESIDLPEGLKYIGARAISSTYAIPKINIPKSVEYMSGDSFGVATAEYHVDKDNMYYTDVDGILFDKQKTKIIKYPSNKTGSSYTIPNSVTSIDNTAFEPCYNLEQIIIPDSVTSIGKFAFAGCSKIESINLPKNITSIDEYTFSGCRNLKYIEIPYGVDTIYSGAFDSCENLKSITIPSTLQSIRYRAFNYCDSLKHIYYGGTAEQWGKMWLADEDNLKGKKIHYTSKAPIIADSISPFIISLPTAPDIGGYVSVGLYNSSGRLIETKIYPAGETIEAEMEKTDSAKYAKIIWWESLATMKPIGKKVTIKLK